MTIKDANGRYVLDDKGEPRPEPDLYVWGRWMETSRDRVVAQTKVGDARVSTVFLGLDHRYGADGPPVLWETMIFGGPNDGYQDRYTSRTDAQVGHLEAVAVAGRHRVVGRSEVDPDRR